MFSNTAASEGLKLLTPDEMVALNGLWLYSTAACTRMRIGARCRARLSMPHGTDTRARRIATRRSRPAPQARSHLPLAWITAAARGLQHATTHLLRLDVVAALDGVLALLLGHSHGRALGAKAVGQRTQAGLRLCDAYLKQDGHGASGTADPVCRQHDIGLQHGAAKTQAHDAATAAFSLVAGLVREVALDNGVLGREQLSAHRGAGDVLGTALGQGCARCGPLGRGLPAQAHVCAV